MVKGDQEKTLGIKNIGRKSNGRLKWCGVFDLYPFVCNFLTHTILPFPPTVVIMICLFHMLVHKHG